MLRLYGICFHANKPPLHATADHHTYYNIHINIYYNMYDNIYASQASSHLQDRKS